MGSVDLPRYVIAIRRAGGHAYYLRRMIRQPDGSRRPRYTRLPHPLDPAFAAAYQDALEQRSGPRRGSIDALIAAFQNSPRYLRQVKSASARSKYAESFRRLSATFGDADVNAVRPHHMLAFIESMAATPAMANRVLSCCNVLWSWAIPRELATSNPCEHVDRQEERAESAPWPIAAVRRAVAEMRPEIAAAVALAYYTAQRKGDLLKLAPAMISGAEATFRQEKTRQTVTLTLNDHALEILEAIWPEDGGTFLRNSRGRSWNKQAFGDAFAKERARIGLDPALKFHGLRHTAAEAVAEERPDLVPALLGHADARTSLTYTRRARQRRDARSASSVIPLVRVKS